MGRDEEEVAAEDDLGDALGDAIHVHNKNAKVKKRKLSSSACLRIIGSCYTRRPKRGKKNWVQHWNCSIGCDCP